MTASRKKQEKLLTEVELEVMSHLWKLGEGTVNDVLASLPAHRKLAYTSVSTMLRILEQKGFVRSRKEGRGHVYAPAIEKKEYETSSVQHLVDRVFDGTPSSLVRRLIEGSDLDAKELESIRKLLDRKLEDER